MPHREPIRRAASPASSDIPDKLYFRIGEVARLCGVPAYVLRFWETEFPQLKPHKGGTGQRLFRRRDVETALRIKTLLYDEGYTIPGARQLLKGEGQQKAPQLALAIAETPASPVGPEQVRRWQRELRELLGLLSSPPERGRGVRAALPAATSARASSDNLFDFPPASPPPPRDEP